MRTETMEVLAAIGIALILIIGCLVITIIDVLHGSEIMIPVWLSSATTLVIGYFFGNHKNISLPFLTGDTTNKANPPTTDTKEGK